MMRHAARLTLLSLLLWANAVAADAPTKITVIGDQSYPPFSFLDEGKPSGIYVDILTKVFAQLPEYDIDIMMMPWRRGLAEIKNSRALAIFPPYYFPKRATLYWCVLHPHLNRACGLDVRFQPRERYPDTHLAARL